MRTRDLLQGPDTVELPASVPFRVGHHKARIALPQAQLSRPDTVRRVIDLPPDLERLRGEDRKLDRSISAEGFGCWRSPDTSPRLANRGWSVGLRGARAILDVHGLTTARFRAERRSSPTYQHRPWPLPRGIVERDGSSRVWRFSSSSTSITRAARTPGGLTKFEPKEMERPRTRPRAARAGR